MLDYLRACRTSVCLCRDNEGEQETRVELEINGHLIINQSLPNIMLHSGHVGLMGKIHMFTTCKRSHHQTTNSRQLSDDSRSNEGSVTDYVTSYPLNLLFNHHDDRLCRCEAFMFATFTSICVL